jgi:hypothetical protein
LGKASEAQKTRCADSLRPTRTIRLIPRGCGFKECCLFPFDVDMVMASRLVRTVDPAAVGADPEMEDRARRSNVFHDGSRILTSDETIGELEEFEWTHPRGGGAAGRGRRRGAHVRRRGGLEAEARLGDLDSDGWPELDGEAAGAEADTAMNVVVDEGDVAMLAQNGAAVE